MMKFEKLDDIDKYSRRNFSIPEDLNERIIGIRNKIVHDQGRNGSATLKDIYAQLLSQGVRMVEVEQLENFYAESFKKISAAKCQHKIVQIPIEPKVSVWLRYMKEKPKGGLTANDLVVAFLMRAEKEYSGNITPKKPS